MTAWVRGHLLEIVLVLAALVLSIWVRTLLLQPPAPPATPVIVPVPVPQPAPKPHRWPRGEPWNASCSWSWS